jgi:outer membrane protein TolC
VLAVEGGSMPALLTHSFQTGDSLQRNAPDGRRLFLELLVVCVLAAEGIMSGQKAPSVPDRPWDASSVKQPFKAPPRFSPVPVLDPAKIYTLSELVNIAEQNNPETRVAWENAKARAADLGITRSALYPTLAAAVLAQSFRADIFFGNSFQRQTVETFAPVLQLDYTIFDFGRRSQEISASKSELLAANCQFNDTHRNVIFQVMQSYYLVLETRGKQEAAVANLQDARTVQQAAEARLQSGLTTLPDVLLTRSATAQADYELQAAIGATEIARGDLAASLGVPPTPFQVEGIRSLTMPDGITDSVETSIDKALSQRPDLMQRVADLRAAGAEVNVARKSYFPTLKFDGTGGVARSHGAQIGLPPINSTTESTWSAELSLNWTLFDGLAREKRVAKARADEKQAAAEVDSLGNQIENQVWSAYATARTALRQQKSAAALLDVATVSYSAAQESYTNGLRSQLDVVSAQRTLADARAADIAARTQLLTALAALAYQTGDLLYRRIP